MNDIFGILFFIAAIQALLVIVGFFMLFSSKAETAKTGRKLFFTGLILFGVELLIGFAICSKL